MVDVEDEPCLEVAVERLTDTEQEIIAQVLARDEEVRELEELRLSRLNYELLELCEKGVPEGSEEEYGRVCLRCRAPLGVLVNSGALCQRCAKRVCKDCRMPYNDTWLCVVCIKEREVKAESGAWFYDNFAKRGKRVYGSALLKRFFRRLKDGESRSENQQKNYPANSGGDIASTRVTDTDHHVGSKGKAGIFSRFTSGAVAISAESSFDSDEPGFSNDADHSSLGSDTEVDEPPDLLPDPVVKIVVSDEANDYPDDLQDTEYKESGFEFLPQMDKDIEEKYLHEICNPANKGEGPVHNESNSEIFHLTDKITETEKLEGKYIENPSSAATSDNEPEGAITCEGLGITEPEDSVSEISTLEEEPEGAVPYQSDSSSESQKYEETGNTDEVAQAALLSQNKADGVSDLKTEEVTTPHSKVDDAPENSWEGGTLLRLALSDAQAGNALLDVSNEERDEDPATIGKEDTFLGTKKEEDAQYEGAVFDTIDDFKVEGTVDSDSHHRTNEEVDEEFASPVEVQKTISSSSTMQDEATDEYYRQSPTKVETNIATDSYSAERIINEPVTTDEIAESPPQKEAWRVSLISADATLIATEESHVEPVKALTSQGSNEKHQNGSVSAFAEESSVPIVNALERHESFLSETGSLESDMKPASIIVGEILLGMKVDEQEKKFEVQIHRVRDLPPADNRKNTTDPYVKTYLLPDRSKTGKRKTKTVKHSLNPDFDEILTYKVSYEELLNRKLLVGVWHHDPLGHNLLLGEVQIVMDAFVQSGFSLYDPIPQWYTLAERTRTRAELKDVGNIKLSLKYIPPGSVTGENRKSKTIVDPASGVLIVKVVSGKNLKAVREDGNSNPFARVTLLPDGTKNKAYQFSTSPQMNTTSPQWDQEFSIKNISWSALHKQVLEVLIYDHEVDNSSVLLGGIRIGLGETENDFDDPYGPEVAIWKTMLDNPNEWNSVTIPLRSSMESLKLDTSGPPVHVKRIHEDSLLSKDYKTGSMGSLDDVGSIKRKSLLKHADQLSLSSFGSMLSIYSDAGGQGSLPITGDVLFSIKYDNVAGVFEIAIVKAKNIAVANKRTQSSDPYVKTYLLPDKSKNSKKKSSVRRRTVNPEWNETIKYKIGEDDLMKRTLQLSLWNYDKFGQNDFLGEVQVQIQKYVKSGHSLSEAEQVWYTLQDSAPVSIGQPGYQGDLTVAVKYDSSNKKLIIDIREAKGLPAADSDGRSDPFVKSYLLPDKTRKTKRKTKVVKKTLDPKWNEKFEYDGISPEELEARVLELTVWDQDKKENIFLGGTRIGLKSGDENWHDCIGKEVQLWQAVIDHPNIWNEYIVPLRDSMTSRKGLDILPPSQEKAQTQVQMAPIIFPDAKVDAGNPAIRLGLLFQPADASERSNYYDENEGKDLLKLHIKEGRYMPLRMDGQAPNTFCKCFITGKRKSAKKKTDIYLRATEPLWDAELCFDGFTIEDLEGRGVEVQILDELEGKSPIYIGFVRLTLGQLRADWDDSSEKEAALWQSMLQKPNQWTYMLLPLREPEKASSKSHGKSESIDISYSADIKKSNGIYNDIASSPDTETSTPAKSKNGEGKSPKTLALEAMGESASDVINILENKVKRVEPEPEPEREPEISYQPTNQSHNVTISYAYDAHNDLPLSPIVEEMEEIEPESPKEKPTRYEYRPPVVHFNTQETPIKSTTRESPIKLTTQETPIKFTTRETPIKFTTRETPIKQEEPKPVVVPDVVVTSPHNTVRPGDPPFKKKVDDYAWDDEDEEATVSSKKSKKDKDKKKGKLMKKPGYGSQESLSSIQSSRSEDLGVYGRVTVRGDIQLGLVYEYGSNTVEIHVFQAQNVAAVDTRTNTSDSYVKTYLMPDKTKATKRKTRVKKNTLDPEWNQIIEYKMGIPELRTRVLVVQVWNRDRLSRNDFLGEVQFRFDLLVDEGKLESPDPVWYPLTEKSPLLEPARHKGILNVLIMFEDPDLKASGRQETDKKGKDPDKKKKKKSKSKSKLIVNIADARDLPAGDKDGYSDPYCKCQLLPLKGKTKRKTHTIRHTLNPTWDYRTEYDVDYEDLAELALEIAVWDWDRGSKDDFLGFIRLNLGEKNSGWDDAEGLELEAWNTIIKKPNKLHEFALPLRSNKDSYIEH